jgi:hypothetical protein
VEPENKVRLIQLRIRTFLSTIGNTKHKTTRCLLYNTMYIILFKSLVPTLQPIRCLGDKDQSFRAVEGELLLFISSAGI